jgi:predicted DNA-binding protein with PD1-like motif
MIFTETREGRRFVGELPPGTPVVASLQVLVTDYRIGSGWIHGSGSIQDPIVRAVTGQGGFAAPAVHPGRHLVAALDAVVSEHKGAPDLVVRVLLHAEGGEVVSGILVEGVSASLEMIAQTFDDITLRRYHDEEVGFARWLDVAVNNNDAVDETVRSGRAAMEAMPSRLLEPTEMPQLRVGDWLQHPRLGTCEIVNIIDDDRVTIRMDTGKVAQLHLGLLSLTRGEKRGGRAIYDVHIRRRNR